MNEDKPLVVMPRLYEINFISREEQWCKISELCLVVKNIAKNVGTNINPTPEELVNNFRALIRYNKCQQGLDKKSRKKFFRYSEDGNSFMATEVVFPKSTEHFFFELTLGQPYPKGMFVSEVWAADLVRAVQLGAIAAHDISNVEGINDSFYFDEQCGLVYLDLGGGRTIFWRKATSNPKIIQ